jgi:hypothetical protein
MVAALWVLAAIGGLAVIAWFLQAIGLKRINLEFENKSLRLPTTELLKSREKPPKELNE